MPDLHTALGRDRADLPHIDRDVLASRYVVNPVYERAALLMKHWPDIPIRPEIKTIIPVYLERREAAEAELKADPNARYQTIGERGKAVLRRVNAPPSKAQTEALKDRLKAAVERWRELQEVPVDADALRAEFQAACWQGHAEMVAAWAKWINSLVRSLSTRVEEDELAEMLCIRLPRTGASRTFSRPNVPQPGAPISRQSLTTSSWPQFDTEFAAAMNIVPPADAKGGRR